MKEFQYDAGHDGTGGLLVEFDGGWVAVQCAGCMAPWVTLAPSLAVGSYPEVWINIYESGKLGVAHQSRELADRAQAFAECPVIGTLHLLPDGSTVMEAP